MLEEAEKELQDRMKAPNWKPTPRFSLDREMQSLVTQKIIERCKEKGRCYSKDWPRWEGMTAQNLNHFHAVLQGPARRIPSAHPVRVYSVYEFVISKNSDTWDLTCKPTGRRFLSLRKANREVVNLVMGGGKSDGVSQRHVDCDSEDKREGAAFGSLLMRSGERYCFFVAPQTEVWKSVGPAARQGQKLADGFLDKYTKCYHVVSYKQKFDAELFDEESGKVLDEQGGPIAATAQSSTWDVTSHGTYTDLGTANVTARDVFVDITKPSEPEFGAQYQWEFRMRQQSLRSDDDDVHWHTQPLQWWDPPLASRGLRKWGHIHVKVEELQIEGPLVLDNGLEDAGADEPFQPEPDDGEADPEEEEATPTDYIAREQGGEADVVDDDAGVDDTHDAEAHTDDGDANSDLHIAEQTMNHLTQGSFGIKYSEKGHSEQESLERGQSENESSESELSEAE